MSDGNLRRTVPKLPNVALHDDQEEFIPRKSNASGRRNDRRNFESSQLAYSAKRREKIATIAVNCAISSRISNGIYTK